MSDMNALALANQLKAEWDGQGFQADTTKDAADMLRRQHEAIVKLRGALADTAQNLVWMQWGDCRKFQTKGPMITVHEAVSIAEKALKDTEEFK